MSKKTIVIALVLAVVAIGSLIAWGVASNSNSGQNYPADGIVYYYGEQCSHCKKVQAFLDENNISSKVSFVKKEVLSSGDKAAIAEWQQRAKECGIKQEEMGVPFVAAEGKCYVGDVDVMDFFKKKAAAKD